MDICKMCGETAVITDMIICDGCKDDRSAIVRIITGTPHPDVVASRFIRERDEENKRTHLQAQPDNVDYRETINDFLMSSGKRPC